MDGQDEQDKGQKQGQTQRMMAHNGAIFRLQREVNHPSKATNMDAQDGRDKSKNRIRI